MARKRKHDEAMRIKGFFRVQIRDKRTGKIVGDSGMCPNQVTNYGMDKCFVGGPVGADSTVQVVGAMLGSGTAPASDATDLPDANTDYYSTVGEAVNNSTQGQLTQSFDGTLGAATIANIGLFAASDGSCLCGNTYSSSELATTQDVNITYNLNYATS